MGSSRGRERRKRKMKWPKVYHSETANDMDLPSWCFSRIWVCSRGWGSIHGPSWVNIKVIVVERN